MADSGTYLQQLTKLEPFVGPLVAARHAGVTGTLTVMVEKLPTVIHIERGAPVCVERGKLGLTLGRLLVERGVLTDAEYEAVMRAMSRRQSGQRFGAVAVSQGVLTEEQVEAALLEQQREKILACIQARAPRTGFASALALERTLVRRPVAIEPLVLAGVRSFFDPERTERVIAPFREVFPALASDVEVVARELGLKRRETELLRRLDGGTALGTLLASSPLDELHAAQIVAALLLLVRLRLHQRRVESTAALRERNVARVRVPVAPQKPAAELPPQAVPSAEPETVREVMGVADRLLRRLGMRRVEPVPVPRDAARADARRDAARAELLFRRGRRSVEQGQFAKALGELRQAAELCPDAAEYALYAAWAKLQTRKDPSEIAAARARLEQAALKALEQDSNLAFAHHAYGVAVLAGGDERAALKAFRAALRLDPQNLDAKRFVRVLGRRTR